MMYFKQVSGKGKVALSTSEVASLFEGDQPIEEPADEMTALKKELSAVSVVIKKLCSNDFVSALLLGNEGKGEENGY